MGCVVRGHGMCSERAWDVWSEGMGYVVRGHGLIVMIGHGMYSDSAWAYSGDRAWDV